MKTRKIIALLQEKRAGLEEALDLAQDAFFRVVDKQGVGTMAASSEVPRSAEETQLAYLEGKVQMLMDLEAEFQERFDNKGSEEG